MAQNNWNELGEEIRDKVNGAIASGDFTDLSRSIGNLVNSAINTLPKQPPTAAAQNQPNAGYGGKSQPNANGAGQPNANSNGQPTVNYGAQKQPAANYGAARYAAARNVNSQPTPSALYLNKPKGYGSSIAMMIFGYSFVAVGFVFSILFAIMCTMSLLFIIPLIMFLAMMVGGLVLGIAGTRQFGYLNRYRKYTEQIGWKLCVSVQSMANVVGKSMEVVVKDLQKMMKQRLFYQAHLDADEGYFLLTDKSYQEYLNTKAEMNRRQRELEKRKTESVQDKEVREMIEVGQSYVQYIRSCNDAIPGEEISAKLDKMEQLVERIFAQVKQNPQLAPELKKMMDYYLPTTAKLLDAYRELDESPATGENAARTKVEIEAAVDTLNVAFEKLLDSLFVDKAWDISSDITVLQTMLAQEGLMGSDFQRQSQN